MSLSAAAISKNYDALAQLISSWVEANPPTKTEKLVYKLVQLRYGQTGSGKTYTISSLEEIVSHDIFPAAESYASTHFANFPTAPRDVFAVGISMYELLGNKVTDLLDRDSPEVDIAEDKFGGIKVSAKVIPVTDAEELAKMIATAVSHRRTSTTLKNETSSRSHCVLNIIVTNTLVPAVEPGRLVLIDLAGSERAADRMAHTKELMNELTLALKPVFDVEATRHSRTVIIAHVSPHLADASHSSNTLTYIAPFHVTATSQSAASSTTSPATWSNEAFRTWVTKTSSKIDSEKLVPFESGKQMCELEESVFIQRCLDSQNDGLDKPLTEAGAKAFYDKLWEWWKELPSVDLDKLMPTMAPNPRRGKDFINGMGEAEFILTVTSSNKDGEAVNDTWNASRTEALTQRDPNGGNGAYDAFNEERLNDPAIYALVYGSQPPP
ncbi:TRAFAC class myosin-kinesin ATPase superfamily Kinesin family [Rhizoctonia solani]|uniref:Kinesin-like protein n=1 Tax=Rhizoctonia solani TaxID=456999 RepID=A0A8H7IDN1_9AGAM|nr:TRAFAC class myosin-kinesin ATPase superfamily Kinesin family [Rhizoctonia solani]